MPIGVFDSGLGGLTVLSALRSRFPDQGFVYLGDNANAPYGTRTAEEIHAMTRAGVTRLFDEGCELVVLACNTAAAVALRSLQQDWLPAQGARRENRVLGVLVPMIEALTGRPWAYSGPPRPAEVKRVGLFATPATVRSHAFPRELAFRASNVEVLEQPCPGLVEALEAGDRTRARALVQTFCQALLSRGAAPQAVVLGCTHYPMAEADFRNALPEATKLYSQAGLTAASLAAYLERHPRFRGDGELLCLTTGEPTHVEASARAMAGLELSFVAA